MVLKMNLQIPLRYKISDWTQLKDCKSNNSRKLHIRVSTFLKSSRLSGTRIVVEDDDFGVLFAYVISPDGTMVSPNFTGPNLSTKQLLLELEKFGFLVTYEPNKHLKGSQIQYLMTLQNLHFDKLRVVAVCEPDGDIGIKIVAFNVAKNPTWINNAYSPSYLEFIEALNNGSAVNLTEISDTQKYDWSWLDFVADIADILKENSYA